MSHPTATVGKIQAATILHSDKTQAATMMFLRQDQGRKILHLRPDQGRHINALQARSKQAKYCISYQTKASTLSN